MMKKKICMGYLCGNAIPFEVFHSCNIKITKVTADGLVSSSSKCHFPTYMCSYAMNCLDIIKNDHQCDGFIFEDKCHAMVALYEYLREYMPTKRIFMFNTIKTSSLYATENYQKEIARLIKFLDTEFNISVLNKELQANITKLESIIKQKRKVINSIAKNSFSISFTDIEVLEKQIGECAEASDVELEKLELKMMQESVRKNDTEILLCGIHITPLDIIDVINEYGGKVIMYDNLEINELENIRLNTSVEEANGNRTEEDIMCNWNPGWLHLFDRKLDRYNIKGIIISTIKFCPIQSYEVILLAELAKQKKVPCLVLNDSFSKNCSAQFHTRIQAFLECV